MLKWCLTKSTLLSSFSPEYFCVVRCGCTLCTGDTLILECLSGESVAADMLTQPFHFHSSVCHLWFDSCMAEAGPLIMLTRFAALIKIRSAALLFLDAANRRSPSTPDWGTPCCAHLEAEDIISARVMSDLCEISASMLPLPKGMGIHLVMLGRGGGGGTPGNEIFGVWDKRSHL